MSDVKISSKKTKPQNMSSSVKRLLSYVFEKKFVMFIVIISLLFSTIGQVEGMNKIQPIIDDYILKSNVKGLFAQVIELSILYVFVTLTTYLYSRLMVYVSEYVTKKLRDELFIKIQKMPIEFFDTNQNGDIMSRFTNDVDIIDQALAVSITNVLTSILMFVSTIVMMIHINWKLFILTFFFIFAMLFWARTIVSRSAGFFARQQKKLGELNAFIEEMLEGQKEVKVFNYENEAIKRYDQKNSEVRKAGTAANINSGKLVPVMINLSNINFALTCVLGAFFAINGALTIGALSVYLQYCKNIQRPINIISQQSNMILMALSGAERIFEILDMKEEEDEGVIRLVRCSVDNLGNITESEIQTGRYARKIPQEDKRSFKFKELKGKIVFDHVNFSYNKKDKILKDVSFYAKEGQKVAFVGSTGAGKTTITNLITRFYDVDSGNIYIDDIDIKEISKPSLRKAFAMVLQDTSMFTDTIEENIRYGRLDANFDEIKVSAKMANANSFIERLPNGYETVIEGNGSSLSQGQNQLISIARAAIAEPPMLILDEATSSIDSSTEIKVTDAMDTIMTGRTSIVIAHRLSTIRNSDVIMVMDHGEIIERGDHESLMKEKGTYYKLYTGKLELA
ncbi:MAG: ABC transporter ATP-binding protein [Peptoniphilaceae bacterium]|nr:ABC transporter ATP-binding protein/permease [Peptoniphilaceae bacterium]MDD7383396.1 ABC transporter ATP-binding protein [Peptoniphilaceae bacterium]MDY3738233.1 ABC transporter ATP-binding protein [Peptoniphilaceae bacterium]